VPHHRDPCTKIPWATIFQNLTDQTNHPVDRDILRNHISHRVFGPENAEVVDPLINDGISIDILQETENGNLKYNGNFVTVPLSTGGEIQIIESPG
jgi:hypothetical protein